MTRIRLFISALLVFAFSINIQAHPSWGIVVDENGCIYFADVMHNGDGSLWRLDPSTSELDLVYSNFHVHQIYLHQSNQIIAAIAKWRSGEIEGEGHNYLFKFDTNLKKLDTLIFTDDWDEFHGQTFAVSNDLKAVYFSMNKQIHIKPIQGKTTTLLPRKFERICTLTTDTQGNLWITDSKYKNGTLFKWTKNKSLKEIANNLMPQQPKNPIFEEKRFHLFYGISFSKSNNPLVTESASRSIKEVLPDGSNKNVYQSDLNWSPNGVLFRNGNYYIMETGYVKKHLGPRIIITDSNFNVIKKIEIDFASMRIK